MNIKDLNVALFWLFKVFLPLTAIHPLRLSHLKRFMTSMASLYENHQKRNFLCSRLFNISMHWTKQKAERAKYKCKCKSSSNGKANLQWTTSLHLSSIALSGMKGFSERHVKYFPSSSTTGMNVRTLNDWLPVSENCGNEWKMIRKLEGKNAELSAHQKVFFSAERAEIKLLSMEIYEALQSTEIFQLRFSVELFYAHAWKYEKIYAFAIETINCLLTHQFRHRQNKHH